MRTPILAPFMLVILAAALYLLPDGAVASWRLRLRGALVRLGRPAAGTEDAPAPAATLSERDLMEVIHRKNAEIADLNRRLRDLGVTRETVPSAKIIPARIVRLGPSGDLDAYTLDAGSRDGAAAGQAVVVGNSLVGVVAKCEETISLALSLSSPGCYVSARLGEPEGAVGRPRQLGAVRGAGGGRVKAIVFSADTAAREGWLAMTSGLEASFPEDLLFGEVSDEFVEGAEEGTMEAPLKPAVDLASLDFVSIVAREDASGPTRNGLGE